LLIFADIEHRTSSYIDMQSILNENNNIVGPEKKKTINNDDDQKQ
jgi:hypothetical protein